MRKQYSSLNLQMREPDPKFSKPNHNIISYVWEHSTMSGAPDRRYKDNRSLPVVEYGNIHIETGNFEIDILHPVASLCEQFVGAVLYCESDDIEQETEEKYSILSPDLQIKIRKLFDKRKEIIDSILSREGNYATSNNIIHIDDDDIESHQAMEQIHRIEKEVCDLLNIKPR